MLSSITKFFRQIVTSLFVLVFIGVVTIVAVYLYYAPQLPSVEKLHDAELKHPIQIYSKEDKLIAEFGEQRRRPARFDDIPPQLLNAVIAIEDARFYQHSGIDFRSVARAISVAVKNNHASQGASTITMQLARNYFLTPERTLSRKVKEIMLAFKIEAAYSKQQILELYLNKIFLGKHAYGIGAAADVYYGKKLNQLTLAQSAMIAGLPKAPSKYNPINNPTRAKQRRNYILLRMLEQHYITKLQYALAISEKITAKYHYSDSQVYAPYMAEMARIEVIKRYGKQAYTLGLKVYTTLDSKEQELASSTLRDHLTQYSLRHGYRGAEGQMDLAFLDDKEKRTDKLKEYKTYVDIYAAVVLKVNKKRAVLHINKQAEPITLRLPQVRWARRYITENSRGKRVRRVSDVLKKGDIVRIQQDAKDKWQLTQTPRVSGALVSLDPHSGAISAIAGGFDFNQSQFNRAIQAKRQPGSSFKPFIYSAALAKGFSPANIINDAPLRLANSSWNPQNFGHRFSGPIRLRTALAKSKNLVAIHLLQTIGVKYAIDYARKFGFEAESLPNNLTIALGTGSVTPLQMATAYASFANGGYKINNYFIRKIENKNHKVLFQVQAPINAERIMKPHVNYQITSMLQSVAKFGTAARAGRLLQRSDIGGKTGTTNQQKDAWFCGFTPNKVTTVWVGFDHLHPLGRGETSTRAALPVWIDFMKVALKDTPETQFPQPQGLEEIKLDARTGSQPTRLTVKTIMESLTPEQIPDHTRRYNYLQIAKMVVKEEIEKTVVKEEKAIDATLALAQLALPVAVAVAVAKPKPKPKLKKRTTRHRQLTQNGRAKKYRKTKQKIYKKKQKKRSTQRPYAKKKKKKQYKQQPKKRRYTKRRSTRQRTIPKQARLERRHIRKRPSKQRETVEIPEQLF
jgi:penicillin-binding protein 1A